jgi:hypothetical protein
MGQPLDDEVQGAKTAAMGLAKPAIFLARLNAVIEM